jgi:hypothetical protein
MQDTGSGLRKLPPILTNRSTLFRQIGKGGNRSGAKEKGSDSSKAPAGAGQEGGRRPQEEARSPQEGHGPGEEARGPQEGSHPPEGHQAASAQARAEEARREARAGTYADLDAGRQLDAIGIGWFKGTGKL